MPTNLSIDEALLKEAQRISGIKTKKETVNSALKEFILRRKQREVVQLFGTIEYDEEYNYKMLREGS
jgi:Arc/MetJ family transcription regulator